AAPRRTALRRSSIRSHRRDPRDRPARVPDPVPRARQRTRHRDQPRLPRSGFALSGADRPPMSIHVALNHVTHYRYDRAVTLGPQVVRLRPAPHSRTRILSYSMRVLPAKHFLNWQQDPQSNYLARLVFPEPTQELRVEIDLVAEMAVHNPFDFFVEPYAEQYPFQYAEAEHKELLPFMARLPSGHVFRTYLAAVDRTPRRTMDFLVQLNQKLQQDISYTVRMEPGVQFPDQTIAKKSGSCRDTGWLLVQLLRHLGFAARFVSGYLIQLVPDMKSLD